jgi:hypothetical protein
MALSGSVKSAPVGAHGFDTDTKLSAASARNLRQAGFVFCIRYVSRADSEASSDLTTAEATAILNAGLALMPVQHVAKSGWIPSADLGTNNGKNAAKNAGSVGFPAGVNLWLDLEGASGSATSQQAIDYCNAWFTEVDKAGFVSGLYVGPQAILNGHDLFFRLRTKHYWKSASHVPNVDNRGYQMVQSLPHKVAGVNLDSDVTKNDDLGDAVIWLVPPAS